MQRMFFRLKSLMSTATRNPKAGALPRARVIFAALVAASVTAACGGGGSDNPGFTVGGTITGLSGSGLVLFGIGTDLSVSGSSFTFSNTLTNGTVYSVTVNTQPTKPSQTCVVENGTGTIADHNVTNITVNCSTNTYSLGGSVSGLTGTGLVLSDGAGATVSVTPTDVAFRFPSVASGVAYNVTVATQPTGQTCSVTSGATGTIGSADITSLALTCVTATSVSGGPTVNGLTATGFALVNHSAANRSGTGQFAYVAAGARGVLGYAVEAGSGALTQIAGSTASGSLVPNALAVDPTGKFAYVTNSGSNAVSVYAINNSTGALTPVAGSPFAAGTTPTGIAVDPSGAFVYVSNSGSNSVSGYAVNASTGALTPLPGSPFAVGSNPIAVTMHPSGRFVYVTNGGAGSVSAFAVDSTTGALTAIGGSPFVGTDDAGSGAIAY